MDQVELSLRFTAVTWPPEKAALSSIPECGKKADGQRPSTPPFPTTCGPKSLRNEEIVHVDILRSVESSIESFVGGGVMNSSHRAVKRGADFPPETNTHSLKKRSDENFSLGSFAFGSFLAPS